MRAEERDPEDFLIDILDSIEKIENFIKGSEFEDFSTDDKTIYDGILSLESFHFNIRITLHQLVFYVV